MTDQQKPERGRFVADGEKVILLHEDGRIEGVDRRPKSSDGGDFVYMKPETTYGTRSSRQPFLTPEANDVLRRHIEEWNQARASMTIKLCAPLGKEDEVQRYADAVGRTWSREETRLDEKPGPVVVYTWHGLSIEEARRFADVGGFDIGPYLTD